jgi:hypothetical protein
MRARRVASHRPHVTVQQARVSNGEQVHRVAGLAMGRKPSVDFSGYWQRHIQAA